MADLWSSPKQDGSQEQLLCPLRLEGNRVWSEDVLVTRKEACRPKDFSRYLACRSSLVCIAELFANLVVGDDSSALGLNGAIFQFLGYRIFSGAP